MVDYRMQTFLVLCRQMNYRKTAEELNMTQPAVTQHIHSLEEYYGCRLFTYDHRELRMTREAELLRLTAENMLYQERRLLESIRERNIRELHIGATKTIGEYVIGADIASFLKEPCNRITVDVDNTAVLLERLSGGELDFALIEGNFDRTRFSSRVYRSEPFVGLCAADHPFAGRDVSVEELLREPLLLREEGSGTRIIFEDILRQYNLAPNYFPRVTCISNFGLLTGLVAHHCGVTFAYEAVKSGNPRLASFQLRDTRTRHDFCYVYLDNPDAAEAVKYFERFRRCCETGSSTGGQLQSFADAKEGQVQP